MSLFRNVFSAEHQRGQNLPEFALASFTFFLLVIGTIEFGQALFTYDLVANAARLGTRYAIVHGSACTLPPCPGTCTSCTATSAQIQTYVRGISPGINTANLTVTTTWPGPGGSNGCTTAAGSPPYNGPGCLAEVTASYPFTFAAFRLTAVTMTSTSEMIISQ
jgi:Flp pilus assembly protein TadG